MITLHPRWGLAGRWLLGALLGVTCVPACGYVPPPPQYEDASYPDHARIDVPPVVFPGVDAEFDGDALVCGGTIRGLTQTRAEMVLVIDRSGSMIDPGSDGVSKWTELRDALNSVLPGLQGLISMGAIAFPAQVASTDPYAASCSVSATLNVVPEFDNARAVLALVDGSSPNGGTPTYDAFSTATRYFASETDVTNRRYALLATDGGPNCNTQLQAATCRCSDPTMTCDDPSDPYAGANCLDDARTIGAIRALTAQGIDTFVVGLPGSESFSDVLDAMAIAGNEPRAVEPRYYAVTSTEALSQALSSIVSGLVDCRFQLEAPPVDPNLVDVRLGGARIPRDDSEVDGWAWVAGSMFTVIQFYGAACSEVQAASGGTQLIAAFGCEPYIPG